MTIMAVRIHGQGGPEVLQWERIELASPAPDEVRLRHTAIGLTFTDVNLRRGGFYGYPLPLPAILGSEAAGIVESCGSGIREFKPGDRVAYVHPASARTEAPGGYCEARNIPASRLVAIPDGVSDRAAAAMLIPGLTASCVVSRMYPVKRGDTVLIHAIAGSTGLILCQWARLRGATVIGTAGSVEKAAVAKAHGAMHVILYRETDFVTALRRLVPEGVDAVFDAVGKETVLGSLDCLKRYGVLVNYGNASGPPPTIDLQQLGVKGSLFAARPRLGDYIATREDLLRATAELFALVRDGAIRIGISTTYRLANVADAHRDLETRRTTGSPVILP